MSVTKRGLGYLAEFTYGGVRYRPPVFATQEAAVKWEVEARLALRAGRELPTLPTVAEGAKEGTLKQALEDAKSKRWAYRRGSHRTVLNAENFVNWAGSKVRASVALSEDNIHKFVRYLISERKVSGSTINRYLAAISVMMEYARVERPSLPYQDRGKNRTRFFTEEEVNLVIQTLTLWGKHRERDLFVFLIETGARPYAEACTLQWQQVGQRKVTFLDTKNGDDRTIPLTSRAWEALQRQRNQRLHGPWVDITEWQMIDLWRNVRIHLPGLSDTVVYTARHTCASWQVIRGIDLMRVMKWMGHRSYQTTLGYAHLTPDLIDNLRALESSALIELMPASRPDTNRNIAENGSKDPHKDR